MATRKKDIPFGQDPATRLLPWIVAVMVFIAGLALAGAFVLSAFADRWEKGLSGGVTVQIPPPSDVALTGDGGSEAARLGRDAILATPGVATATVLPVEEMRRLLEPWLGTGIDPRDLPLPTLIAVEFDPGLTAADVDLRDMRRRLQANVPNAQIDDHAQWQARLVDFLGALRLVAAVLVGIVALAGAVMVVFATRGGLLAHRDTIELLHLVGAHDGYIASQFQSEALKAGLKGGLLGLLAAAGTVLALGQGAAATGTVLPGVGVLAAVDWIMLAMLPLVSAAVAAVAARITVLRALGRMV
jgi:cell division transport system permease protein